MLQDKNKRIRYSILKLITFLMLSLGCISQSFALPSFARQTGDSCDSCHVGAYGPQLTPHGMKFKLGGYTDSDGKKGHIPLAVMLIDNYTHTSKDQDHSAEGFSPNGNNVVQEISVFLAGKLSDHVGSFMQVTHAGVDKVIELDNTEFRYAQEAALFGQKGTYGIAVNNNPTMQDPFNTLSTWRFPYNSADLADAPGTAPILDGGLAGQVYGVTAYTQQENGVYAEFGFYRSFTQSILDRVNVGAAQELSQSAPYWRVAYVKDMHKDVYSVGLVGLSSKVHDYGASGPDNKILDIGIDGHYQYLGNRKNIISVDGSYIRETQDMNDAGINQLIVAASYYYNKTYGGTAQYFSTTTSGSNPSLTDSNGMMFQADWTPFGKEDSWKAPYANMRLGLQYTLYNKFDGNSSNASDFNTVMAFLWLSM